LNLAALENVSCSTILPPSEWMPGRATADTSSNALYHCDVNTRKRVSQRRGTGLRYSRRLTLLSSPELGALSASLHQSSRRRQE
jgi:hypothetical protein